MATDPTCEGVRVQLLDALVEAREAPRAARDHARGCAGCARYGSELRAVVGALEADPGPALAQEVASAVERRALEALRRRAPAPPERAPAALPPGYRRELVRLLSWTLPPLPLAALCVAGALALGRMLLADWLPAALLWWLGFALVLSALSWAALIYGSLPFVAYHRTLRRGPASLRGGTS